MPRVAASRGREFERYSVYNFAGGLDLRTNPRVRAIQKGQNTLSQANECLYTSSGAVARRLRSQRVETHVGSVRITGGVDYRTANGTQHIVIGTDDGRLLEVTGTTSAIESAILTTIGTGFTVGTRWYFATINDKLLCCNRADALRSWDGTTLSTISGTNLPLTPGPIAVWRNYVFALDATNKSRISWCANPLGITDETDWSGATSGFAQIDPGDGAICVNLVPGVSEMIVLKSSRPYRWQGGTPSSATVLPTTGAVGSASHHGAVFALNDVWYLSRSGVVKLSTSQAFGDLKSSFPSDAIRPYFEPYTSYSIASQQLDAGMMAYDSSMNLIYIAVDTNGDRDNDLLLVYDGRLNAWSTWRGLDITAMFPVVDPESGRIEIWVGVWDGTFGRLRVLNRKTSTSGVTYSPEARHLSVLNAPGIDKSIRHGFFYFAEKGSHTVTVDCKIDNEQVASKSYSVSMLGASKTLGSTWTLGVDPLGARSSIAKRVDLSGVGESFEFGVKNASATQEWEWLGYDIFWRPRRTIRRGA